MIEDDGNLYLALRTCIVCRCAMLAALWDQSAVCKKCTDAASNDKSN